MTIRFKQKEFTDAVKLMMQTEILKHGKNISLRDFEKHTEVSYSTLSRVQNGHKPDVETFLKLCFWMKIFPNAFYNY